MAEYGNQIVDLIKVKDPEIGRLIILNYPVRPNLITYILVSGETFRTVVRGKYDKGEMAFGDRIKEP